LGGQFSVGKGTNCRKAERMDFDAESSDVLLLELTSQVALDEGSLVGMLASKLTKIASTERYLASTAISDENEFECWDFGGRHDVLDVLLGNRLGGQESVVVIKVSKNNGGEGRWRAGASLSGNIRKKMNPEKGRQERTRERKEDG